MSQSGHTQKYHSEHGQRTLTSQAERIHVAGFAIAILPTRRGSTPRLREIPGYASHIGQGCFQATFKPLEQKMWKGNLVSILGQETCS